MAQFTLQQAFDLAFQQHQAGRLHEAENLYRQILVHQPDHVDALHLLGVIALQSGKNDIALDLLGRAVALKPNFAEAFSNLGNALRNAGRLDDAIAAYRRAIELRPDYAETHNNLGSALTDSGRFDEAVAACRQAVALNPNLPEPHSNLGNALKEKGQFDEAIAAHRHAIALRPRYDEAHSNLGNALKEKGQLDEAIAAFRHAIALRPANAGAFSNLGSALRDKGQLDEAIAACQKAIALRPNFPQALANLGNALKDKGQLDEAVAAYRRAIELSPNLPDSHNNLGNALKDKGQLDDAVAAFRRAIALRPGYAEAHSNLIYALHFHPDCGTRAIADELARWNREHAEPLQSLIKPHANHRDPDRRLRIGYVSPDFRDHVIGRNLLPLFQHHDRGQFEITCYSQTLWPDAMTGRFKQHADRWHSIVGVSDEQAADQIRADRIDILVDLTLHLSQNRLRLFARKPAPMQATFAGYPGSTGLSAIDYRLSDPYLDPDGIDESIYSERTIRLPDSFWCYDPLECGVIPVNSLPALSSGVITLGCLNNFCKFNDAVLVLWASVLRQVPTSRLLLLAPVGDDRSRVLSRFQQEGIDPGRVEFVAFQSRENYLQTYHRIDVGLDTFPYNGHTTSLDSFWMGVPVVTLVGTTPVSRAGWSQLSNFALTELAGRTPEQFVRIAVELASDMPRLAQLRSTLRPRMEQSPLMDAARFARGIENAYRGMWRTWEGDRHEGT